MANRLRRLFPRGKRAVRRAGAQPFRSSRRSAPEPALLEIDEGEVEAVDPAELEEFLAADTDPPAADPAFKEALRERLWTLIEDRAKASGLPPARSRGGSTPVRKRRRVEADLDCPPPRR